jgi:hypothetical protein
VVNEGIVVELGTHEELLTLKGLYFDLVSLQMNISDDDGSTVVSHGVLEVVDSDR